MDGNQELVYVRLSACYDKYLLILDAVEHGAYGSGDSLDVDAVNRSLARLCDNMSDATLDMIFDPDDEP